MNSDHDQSIGASLQIAIELRGQAPALAQQAEAERGGPPGWAALAERLALGGPSMAEAELERRRVWAGYTWPSIATAAAAEAAEAERQAAKWRALANQAAPWPARVPEPVHGRAEAFTLRHVGQAIAVAIGLGISLAEILRLLRQLALAAAGETPAPWAPSAVAELELQRLQELGIASRAELAAEGLLLDPLGGLQGTPAELLQAALAVMRRKYPPTYAAEAWQLGRAISGGLALGIAADRYDALAEAARQAQRMGRKKIRRHLRVMRARQPARAERLAERLAAMPPAQFRREYFGTF